MKKELKILKFLLEKEFRQIRRNRMIFMMIFMMPAIQLLVLPWAADYEVKNINLSVVDNNQGSYSQRLVRKIASSGYFRISDFSPTYDIALRSLEQDQSDLILEIPFDFEQRLIREGNSPVLIAANAVNGTKGGLGGAYLGSIINDFASEIRIEQGLVASASDVPVICIIPQNRFNARLDYQTFMVPGILAMLLTLIGGMLAALNIVAEKEAGTIEQMNVTPVPKELFILSKLIPMWCIGFVILAIGMVIAYFVYGIVPQGSLLTIAVFAFVYMVAFSGFGILLSTVAQTQQQAMFLSFFFMMIFFLTAGLFSPIESMPDVIRYMTYLNPVTYLVEVIRLVMLKGSMFGDILPQFGAVCAFAVVFNTLAVLNYRKSS